MAPFFIGLLSVLLGIVSVLIVLIVLMQRPKQEGLGAAFGGGMTDQMFGAQTTNVLQKGTVYLAVMFFVFSMILSVLTAKSVRGDSDTIDAMKEAPAPPPIRRLRLFLRAAGRAKRASRSRAVAMSSTRSKRASGAWGRGAVSPIWSSSLPILATMPIRLPRLRANWQARCSEKVAFRKLGWTSWRGASGLSRGLIA